MPSTLRIYDPAMCCPTGVCGPSIDKELARFAADLDWLGKQGVAIERYNLSSQPAAFAATPAVKEALFRGTEVLPILMVDDRIVAEGVYPSRETLAALSGLVLRKATPPTAAGPTCTPTATAEKPAAEAMLTANSSATCGSTGSSARPDKLAAKVVAAMILRAGGSGVVTRVAFWG